MHVDGQVVAAGSFRCMSYNILVETKVYARRDSQWPNRRDLLIKQIHDRAPDLLGIQECGPKQVHELREALCPAGYHTQHLFREVPGEEAEGLMLAVNPATMEVGGSGHFWLATATPHIVGSKAPGAEHPRVAMWVACSLRGHGGKILFLNFHLDHPTTEQGELNRQRSANEIVTFISEPRWAGYEVLLVGDLNGERVVSLTMASWALARSSTAGQSATLRPPRRVPRGLPRSTITRVPRLSRRRIGHGRPGRGASRQALLISRATSTGCSTQEACGPSRFRSTTPRRTRACPPTTLLYGPISACGHETGCAPRCV